jgi:hypothetical protein
VNSAVQNVQSSLATLAAQQGMSTLQVINSIQAGNCDLASKFAQCCCENKLLVTEQGYQAQIATLNQTNQLGSQADRNANNLMNAINAQTVAMNDKFCELKERELQNKIDTQGDIITQLRGQISNDKQTEAFTAAFNQLNDKINTIANRQPNTIPVQWPNVQAVNTTPWMGNYWGGGQSYWG